EVERHASRVAAQRTGSDPHELTARAQLVHPGGRVGADPTRQHISLPCLHRECQPLERDEDLSQAIYARTRGGMTIDALPARKEYRQRRLINRLDLLAKNRQRSTAKPSQHVGIAPFALC